MSTHLSRHLPRSRWQRSRRPQGTQPLSKLWLSHTAITVDGARALVEAATSGGAPKQLWIGGGGAISPADAEELAEYYAHAPLELLVAS